MATFPSLAASVSNGVSLAASSRSCDSWMDAFFEMKTGSPVASASLSMPRQGFVKVCEAVDAAMDPAFMNSFRLVDRLYLF